MPWAGLIQLSGHGLCSAALPWLLDAQAKSEPVAWVGSSASLPFAPDLVGAGLDLRRMLWVRVQLESQMRATELLLRSGAFGCVVVDLGDTPVRRWPSKSSWQSRIATLARKHQSAVLLLAYDEEESSMGALVNVRIRYERGVGEVLRNKSAVSVASHVLHSQRDDPDGVVFAKLRSLVDEPAQRPVRSRILRKVTSR